MYTALDLSKYIVSKCINDGHPITNLQLQKILYYIQKDFLRGGERAFPEDIEAWKFGPVVPNVYYSYCGFGAMPISLSGASPLIESRDADRINAIVEKKRDLYPWDLVGETHRPGGAWAKTFQEGQGNHKVIPTDLIRKAG